MTSALPRETAGEPGWATPADFRAAWAELGRALDADGAADPFRWLDSPRAAARVEAAVES